ncbi:metallophosphoesterase [Williamsia sp. MIQD14]|uniref:metallophosphoesterase n=1 Tax=Williamsia sp. MIQD14 TaxID=3425703 RepID=UPI003DA14010
MSNLPVVGVLLVLITVVLHRRFVRSTRLSRRVAIGADVVLVVAGILALIGFGSGSAFDPAWSRWPAFAGWTWMAVVLYLVLGTVVLGVITLVMRLVHAARGGDSTSIRLRTTRIGSAVVVVASVAAVGYGLLEAAHPRVTRTTVALDRLPAAFAGTSVALVSDLHAGPSRGVGFVREVVDRINAQRPDMVILDGDLIDGTVEHVGSDLAPLRDLSAPLGVFAVSGNHEFYAGDGGRWLDLWDSLGVNVLRNERATVTRDGAQIDVAGINDATAPAPHEPDLTAALAGRDPSRFVLLLAHQPLQAHEASDAGVDMQVSGHTHAGQIWPLRYLVPLQQPTVEGLDTIGDTTIYTTRGAGAWGPPVRVGAPPEIAMLTLASPG